MKNSTNILSILLFQITISCVLRIVDANMIDTKVLGIQIQLYISVFFIAITFFMAIYFNNEIKRRFIATKYALITSVPFTMLVMLSCVFRNASYSKIIAIILPKTFGHLTGFSFIISQFKFTLLYDMFFVINISIFIHCLGFALGDIYVIIKNRRIELKSNEIKKCSKKYYNDTTRRSKNWSF